MKGPRAEGTAAPCRIGDVVCHFNGNEALSQLKDHGFAMLKVVQNRITISHERCRDRKSRITMQDYVETTS